MTVRAATRLGREQPGAAERGAAEQAEHAVAAVEAGLDGLPGEGGGDEGEREDARRDDVDPAGRSEVGGVRLHQTDQHQGREHHGDQQLLAVAHQHRDLAAGLGEHPLPGRRGAGRGSEVEPVHGHDRARPVRSR